VRCLLFKCFIAFSRYNSVHIHYMLCMHL